MTKADRRRCRIRTRTRRYLYAVTAGALTVVMTYDLITAAQFAAWNALAAAVLSIAAANTRVPDRAREPDHQTDTRE